MASRLILAVRIAIVLAALGVAAAALWATHHRGTSSGARYACPMHPEAKSDAPGECPICHMALEAKDGRAQDAPSDTAMSEPPDGSNAAELTTSRARELVSYVRFAHFGLVRKEVVPGDIEAPAWIDGERDVVAILYDDEVSALEKEQRGSFFAANAGASWAVRRTDATPTSWDRSTSQVRFRIEGDAPRPLIRDRGWIRLAQKRREVLVVPATAVLESQDGPYVLVGTIAGRKLTRRRVQLGREFSGLAAIVSGVQESETVVTMNAFFLAAERRLRGEAEFGLEANP
jgi:hypothetical protein